MRVFVFSSVLSLLVMSLHIHHPRGGILMANGLSMRDVTRMAKQLEEAKEESRKLRRTIFTSTDWKKHRSSHRYFKELFKMPRSMLLRGVAVQALGVAFTSACLVLYNSIVEKRIIPWRLPLLTLPMQPFSLTSPSPTRV